MKRPKVLVAYHSVTGHSRALADELAAELGATVHTIRCPSLDQGFLPNVRRVFSSLFKTSPAITVDGEGDVADFDLLVLGGPVWAGSAAAPLTSYIKRAGDRLPNTVAVFLCSATSGPPEAANRLTKRLGHAPAAFMNVGDEERTSGRQIGMIQDFVEEVSALTQHVH